VAVAAAMKRDAAFSLVELLVVLAIIAVLAGVASGAWHRALGSSQAAQCLSTMRELSTAMQLWSADRGGEFPRSSHSAFAHRSRGWQREILPYLGEAEGPVTPELQRRYFRCPSDARTNGTSYGLNVFFELDPEADDYEGAPARWRRASSLPAPSRTVLLAEIKTESSADHVMAHFWSGSAEGGEVAVDRHDGRSNFVFADGSAALLRVEETYDPGRGINRWNPSLAGQ
jgi:prepilin-type N-terminal cleavage/methylation domain-containing protein/prepilin-type processing-associated H-X9-DG protein